VKRRGFLGIAATATTAAVAVSVLPCTSDAALPASEPPTPCHEGLAFPPQLTIYLRGTGVFDPRGGRGYPVTLDLHRDLVYRGNVKDVMYVEEFYDHGMDGSQALTGSEMVLRSRPGDGSCSEIMSIVNGRELIKKLDRPKYLMPGDTLAIEYKAGLQ
jgi:hypothetical protein